VITKVLVSVAIMLGAAVSAAIPASADPSPFSTLGCSCQAPGTQGTGTIVTDPITQGFQQGQSDLRAIRGQQ
jgi:hypothetical protein